MNWSALAFCATSLLYLFFLEMIEDGVNAFLRGVKRKYRLGFSNSLHLYSNQLLEYSFSRNKPLKYRHEKDLLSDSREGWHAIAI
jgi:hypothetical protein